MLVVVRCVDALCLRRRPRLNSRSCRNSRLPLWPPSSSREKPTAAAAVQARRADLAGSNDGASVGGGGSWRRAARSLRAPRPRCASPRRARAATRHERLWRRVLALAARGEPERAACDHGDVLAAAAGECDVDAERRGGDNSDGRRHCLLALLGSVPVRETYPVVSYLTCVRHNDRGDNDDHTRRDNRNQDRDHNRHE